MYSSSLVSDSTISQSSLYYVVINTKTKVYFILTKNLFPTESLYPEEKQQKKYENRCFICLTISYNMVSYQCHHPFLPVKLRGQHPRVRLHADFCRGSRAITYPKTCNRRRLESRCRLFMVVHVAANIPELLSSRSLPVHHQYRNQPVNQHRSCSDAILAYIFSRENPTAATSWDARDHGRHYPIYPYPPETIQLRVSILVSLAVLASCTRAIVVEKTTIASPNTSVRQKCGISGFTMFWGGTSVMLFLILIALVEHYFAKELMAVPFSMLYLPNLTGDFPPDDDYCRLRDRFPTHLTLYIPVLRHPANGNCRNLHDLPGLPAHANLRSGGMDCSLLHRLTSRLGHERLHLSLHHHPRFPTHLDHASKTSGRKSLETIHDGLNN